MSKTCIARHDAPEFLHNSKDPMNWMGWPIVFSVMLGIPLTIILASNGLWVIPAIVGILVAIYLLWINKFIISCGDDHGTNYNLTEVVQLYRNNPHLEEELKPVVQTCYKLAPKGLDREIAERRRVMMEFIAENPRPKETIGQEDLDNLKLIMETRREMRKEGLL